MTTLNNSQKEVVEALNAHYGKTELSRSEINDFIKSSSFKNPSWLKSEKYKIGRGMYQLPVDGDINIPTKTNSVVNKTETADVPETINQAAFIVSSLTGNIVPVKDPVFVPWGHFKDIKSIVT